MKKITFASILILGTSGVIAKQDAKTLTITSPKSAMQLIQTETFGSISLKSLSDDITNGIAYKSKAKFPQGYVAIESQNDYGHYGSLDFEFKPPFDFSKKEIDEHFNALNGVKKSVWDDTISYTWKSYGFNCEVSYRETKGNELFQYLCHRMIKK